MTIRKKIPQLRAITQTERSTAVKARESRHVLGIISEFVEATEKLAERRPRHQGGGQARRLRGLQTKTGRRIPLILMGSAFWKGLLDGMRSTREGPLYL
jgi:hypothetical protein